MLSLKSAVEPYWEINQVDDNKHIIVKKILSRFMEPKAKVLLLYIFTCIRT